MTTDNKQSFKVEKTNTTNPIKTANTLNEKMSEAANNQDRLAIIKEFFEKSPMLKKALEKYVIGATDSLTILNALPTNARKYLAQKLTQKGLLKEEDIEKLKLSINEKQLLITMYRKIQKPEEQKSILHILFSLFLLFFSFSLFFLPVFSISFILFSLLLSLSCIARILSLYFSKNLLFPERFLFFFFLLFV